MADLGWREFERLIGELFRKRGFSVKEKEWAGPDGGMDGELRRNGELFLVECKRWRAPDTEKACVTTCDPLHGSQIGTIID